MLLVVLPWSGFWEHNYFGETWPALLPILTNNFVRGGISGIGLVDLVAGFADLAVIFGSRERREVTLDEGSPRSL